MDLANLQIQDGFHPAIPSPALTPTRRASKLKPLPITGKGGKIFDHPAIVLPQDIQGRELREFGYGSRKRRRPKLQRQLSLIDLEYEIEEFSIHGSLRKSNNRSSRSPLHHHRSDQNLRDAVKPTKVAVTSPRKDSATDSDVQTRFNFTTKSIENFSEIGRLETTSPALQKHGQIVPKKQTSSSSSSIVLPSFCRKYRTSFSNTVKEFCQQSKP